MIDDLLAILDFFKRLVTYIPIANFLTIHSVLEEIYPEQRLPKHESIYPIVLKSARIEIPHIGSHYIDFSKTDFY